MTEIAYFPQVEVEATPSSLYETLVVGVPDETGNRHFLRVARGAVNQEGGKNYLPISVIEVDSRQKRALIQLPYEADSGANRLWVPFRLFRQEVVNREESETVT